MLMPRCDCSGNEEGWKGMHNPNPFGTGASTLREGTDWSDQVEARSKSPWAKGGLIWMPVFSAS